MQAEVPVGLPGRQASRASRRTGTLQRARECSAGRLVTYVCRRTCKQAEELSLEAQRSAIESYCAVHENQLVKLCQDVMSGRKDVRPGLADALRTSARHLRMSLIVLKFDQVRSCRSQASCGCMNGTSKGNLKGTRCDSGVGSHA